MLIDIFLKNKLNAPACNNTVYKKTKLQLFSETISRNFIWVVD